MPMYRVGHLDRVAALERELSAEEGRIALAGAFYRGSGVPDCIRQGRDAARLLSTRSTHGHEALG
jgi:oxygen-dependent protoporphyrinogen oxidase